jgi:uncharacterized repeat protein (TIGR03803 family)
MASAVLALVLALAAGAPARAQVFEALHAFDNPPQRPIGGLTAGPGGMLYGPASGGSFDAGSVLVFAPPSGPTPGVVSLFSSLPAISEYAGGALPLTPLTLASDGNFYGVRDRWSNSSKGAIYRVSPAGVYGIVHELAAAEGSGANGPCVEVSGALYGTLYWGGAGAKGAVYRLWLADQRFEIVHEFTGGSEGTNPEGGLVLRPQDGWLYGTTRFGGSANQGTIYRISPTTGTLETLYEFQRAPGWVSPTGELTVRSDGLLYGAASYGFDAVGGCVFSFDPDTGTLTPLHVFDRNQDKGSVPAGSMVIAGSTLYGVATGIGYTGPGTVFRIDLASGNQLTVLRSFESGRRYSGRLVRSADGLIYGIASGAFRGFDAGEIFRIDPASGSVATAHEFGVSATGRVPFSLVESAAGVFHISSRAGGQANRGVVLRAEPDGTLGTLYSFEDGALSDTTRTFLTPARDGLLYGTRSDGGAPGYGSLFTLDPTAGEYRLLYAPSNPYPLSDPHGPVIESAVRSDAFYGNSASTFEQGTAYELSPGGTVTPLWEPGRIGPGLVFTEPVGRLLEMPDGTLYGTYREWLFSYYVYGLGGVFRIVPGSTPEVLKRLSFYEGVDPEAGLTLGSTEANGPTVLYGTTARGGQFGRGTLFSITSGGQHKVLHHFGGGDGDSPMAELTRAADGRLYGTTRLGGQHGHGTIFALAPDDTLETVHHFDWADGVSPETPLVAAVDGNLYGVVPGGGPLGGGVLFRYNLAPTVIAGGPYDVLEGGSVTLTAAGSDPQGGPLQFAWDLDSDGAFDDATGASVVYAATTPERDGDGAYDVAVRATDESGIAVTARTTVTVRNVAPTVSAGSDATLDPGDALERAGSFTDPGPDTWTATVDYGDGSGPAALALAGTSFTLSHVYPNAGLFTVTVVVVDDDGGRGTATFMVKVRTAADLINELIDDVEDLYRDDSITRLQRASLVIKLRLALFLLQTGNTQLAETMLNAFIAEVDFYIRNGVLTHEEGDPLLEKARSALDLIP